MSQTIKTWVDKQTGLDCELLIEQDDSQVRGNALASGDDALDRTAENDILGRLDSGDISAWCGVVVNVTISAWTGTASIWACTLDDTYTADIVASDHGLLEEAFDDLLRVLNAAAYEGIEAKGHYEVLEAIADQKSDTWRAQYGLTEGEQIALDAKGEL